MSNSASDSSLDLPPSPASNKSKLRGLWGVMREPAESDSQESSSSAETDPAGPSVLEVEATRACEAEDSDAPSGVDAPAAPPRRGLWKLMGGATADTAPPSETSAPIDNPSPTASSDRAAMPLAPSGSEGDFDAEGDAETESRVVVEPRRGLWSLMRSRSPVVSPPSEVAEVATSVGHPLEAVPREADLILELTDEARGESAPSPAAPVDHAGDGARPGRSAGADVDDESELELIEDELEEPPRPPTPPIVVAPRLLIPATDWTSPRSLTTHSATQSRMAVVSLVLGSLSAPLSALAFFPQPWMRIPASAVGFLALAAGLAAWNELSRPRSRKQGKPSAVIGLASGLAGMFLGPVVFAPLGESWRDSTGRGFTVRNLETVGEGLAQYHQQNEQYPAGGVFQKDRDGRDVPMHGWMTALLPYVGESALYESIRLRSPYDHPDNLAAMSQEVPAYLASGGDRKPIGRGFAPAHFAGLGGTVVVAGRGLVHFGVFERNSAVTRSQVVDGESQTLIVGEVAQFYPPWGEPENWRSIGSGLNRQPRGFGNAAGTGAMFLKADGSVQFFSNETSPEVLQALGTRDGGEPAPVDP